MSISPAEPLGDGAAEFAFELDVVSSMSLACFITTANGYSGAFTTDQLFLFEVIVCVLSLFTVLHTTEIGIATFEALII